MPMAEYRGTVRVAADPSEVLPYVADLTNLTEWDSSVRAVVPAEASGPVPARRYDVVVGFYGRELKASYEIVDDSPDAVAWRIDGKVSGTARVAVTARAGGSDIDYRLAISLKGLARLLDRGLNVALEGIGANAEQGLQRQFGC